ncbi:Ldh family oxidoreductase [Georgenia alba]|uniref:Ldh family oxidoreductase n=1 Tax=Georgenia alba TaxID=2233858 RepID=A0ABW2Q702_9MICO
MDRSYPVDALVALGARALEAAGVPSADAELTAAALVDADRRGIASHGLLRLPLYVSSVQARGVNARPNPTWVREHGAVAVLDADAALGQVAMAAATERAAQLAGQFGVAVVAVQNSTHYGAGAYWTERLTARGLLGILTSTTGVTVTPFGGVEKVLGTNPLTLAAPSAGPASLTADMATSAGAYGKVVAAQNEGKPIPEGWAVDADGRPTTDPTAALAGALLPFGGPKGSAVAVLLEALAASLTTASYAYQTEDIWANRSARMNTGHLLLAIDTAAFTSREHTERRVADLQEKVRASAAAGETTFAPGDIEHAHAQSHAETVPLAGSTVAQLVELLTSLGLETTPLEP